MSFYAGLVTTAAKLLKDKGQPMVIRRKAVVSRDPAAGTVTTAAQQDFVVHGVLVNYNTQLVADSLVQKGDRQAIIEGGVVAPTKEDQLVAEGRTWAIVDFESVNPAGTTVIYKLQVRS